MNTTGRSAFGVRLAKARKYAKLTQINAAKLVKMAQGTLAELELEGQGSSYTAQLAETYGVNPNWLATGKGDMLAKDGLLPAQPKNELSKHAVPQQESHELTDALTLLELFSRATPAGRSSILQTAIGAEKIVAKRDGMAAKEHASITRKK